MASARLLKNEPRMSPAPGALRCFSSRIPLLFSTEISRDPVTSRFLRILVAATLRPGSTALWAIPDSQDFRARLLLAPLSDPRLPPLTHRKPQKRTLRLPTAPVCLPGKLHTPPTHISPQAPACLYLWVVCVDVETSGVWSVRCSALQEEGKVEDRGRLVMEGGHS